MPLVAALGLVALAAPAAALLAEVPAPEPIPPSMASLELRSGGAILNGLVYRAAGGESVRRVDFDDDHVFSVSRIGLGEILTSWLNGDCAAHQAARAAKGAASAVREQGANRQRGNALAGRVGRGWTVQPSTQCGGGRRRIG